jgi:hypothetical protein
MMKPRLLGNPKADQHERAGLIIDTGGRSFSRSYFNWSFGKI